MLEEYNILQVFFIYIILTIISEFNLHWAGEIIGIQNK